MNEADFEKGAQRLALIPEKLDGLIDAGIEPSVLSEAFGVGESTVNSWRLGAAPTERSADRLDELTDALHGLTEAGARPATASKVLQGFMGEEKLPAVFSDPKEGFKKEAGFRERIVGLMLAGFSSTTIAKGAGVSKPAVAKWQTGERDPHSESFAKIDTMRRAMEMLIEAGLEPDVAAVWIQTPVKEGGSAAPIDALATKSKAVFGMIDLLFVQPFEQ